MPVSQSIKRILFRLSIFAFLVAWFKVPMPGYVSILGVVHPEVKQRNMSYSCNLVSNKNVTYELKGDITGGTMSISLLDGSGQNLAEHGPFSGKLDEKRTFRLFGQELQVAKNYRVQVSEEDLSGCYRLKFFQLGIMHPWGRALLLFVCLALLVLVLKTWKNLAGARFPFNSLLIVAAVISAMISTKLFYLVLHEGSHALFLASFGVFDLGGSDMLGIFGRPHVGKIPGVPLTNMQEAIHSLAGPAVPILAGLLLFVLLRTRWTKDRLSSRPLATIYLNFLTFVFLFSALGMLLVAAGLVPADGDYRHFSENITAPGWIVPTITMVVSALSVYLSVLSLLRSWKLFKQWRKNQALEGQIR